MNGQTRTLETLEMVGGALCLDFANTVNSRRAPEHDYLSRYSELVDWAVEAGILTAAQGRRLQERATAQAEDAQRTLQEATGLRELIYRIFSKVATGSEPEEEDLQAMVKSYADALSQSEIVRNDDFFAAGWQADQTLDALLRPIAYSAGELLLSKGIHQVKECPGCGWLFIDTSKNQSRRWCSMNTCGARDKMRRYHHRMRSR